MHDFHPFQSWLFYHYFRFQLMKQPSLLFRSVQCTRSNLHHIRGLPLNRCVYTSAEALRTNLLCCVLRPTGAG